MPGVVSPTSCLWCHTTAGDLVPRYLVACVSIPHWGCELVVGFACVHPPERWVPQHSRVRHKVKRASLIAWVARFSGLCFLVCVFWSDPNAISQVPPSSRSWRGAGGTCGTWSSRRGSRGPFGRNPQLGPSLPSPLPHQDLCLSYTSAPWLGFSSLHFVHFQCTCVEI